VNRLDAAFERLKEANELGLFPYLMTGYPDPASCAELLDTLAAAGADGIELAVPFSDPLADGTTIQRAGALALEQGASMEMALGMLREFRTRWQTPVVLMTYYNPVLAYGPERLAREGAAAGLDGLIVPDVPLEEAGPLQAICRAAGLHLISLVAPTSTDARLAQTAEMAGGFIYCVALVGVTGARAELSEELPTFLGRVRTQCRQPLVIGFGIAKPEHVRALHGLADGVIVASALADLIEATPAESRRAAVESYLRAMKAATRPNLATAGPG
jgi:tryptophan synthase alpha chain